MENLIKGLQTTLGKMEIALGAIHEAILWTSPAGKILWCNRSLDELLGRPHITTLGANVIDVFPLEKDGVPLASGNHPYQQTYKAASLSDNIYVFKRKEKLIYLEIAGSTAEFKSSDIIIILTIRNVTALLASRDALLKAKDTLEFRVQKRTDELQIISDRYKSIVFEAVDAIITIDQRGIIKSFNPAAEKMFGYREHEIIGKNVNILMPDPHRENHDHYIRNYLKSGTKKIIGLGREVLGSHRDGQSIPLELAVSETRTKSEILFTGIMRDMSDRKKAEEVLEKAKNMAEQANQVKSEFLARMSHEIRTPMNAILGMAELLHETSLSQEQEKYLDIFKGAGEHLLFIINDLLDLEKIEADRFSLETIAFDAHKLFSETHAIMAIAAEKKKLVLEHTVDPETPVKILGDPIRLRQILINIIGNAIKFTEIGTVSFHVYPGTVEASEKDSSKRLELHFEIKDTGVGIEENQEETIFESFAQADHSITRKFSGTGLGLAISRKLIRQMGGDISVSSRIHGGSTFTFNCWFEAAEQNEKNASANIFPPDDDPDVFDLPDHLRILLVDDSDENRFLFGAFLKQLDCTLEFAENGMIAVQKFKSSKYDLVLMDIQMPVLDGYSATQLIRAHEKQNAMVPTPIVALTAHASKEEKEKSRQAGCDMHVTKPVSKKNLLTAIHRLVGKKVLPKKTVHIDKLLEDLIPDFLENRRNNIDALREAVRNDDMAMVEHLGHTMKGTGGGYGFQEITEIGDALERGAQQQDQDCVLGLAKKLETYLDTLEVVFVE